MDGDRNAAFGLDQRLRLNQRIAGPRRQMQGGTLTGEAPGGGKADAL